MKKSENSKILPYTKKQIASVILHPETCNIRGYEKYHVYQVWYEGV